MDAKQLEKIMGFAPESWKRPQRHTKKMSGQRVAPSSWEGRRSPMSQALFCRHVWANRFLKRLTQRRSVMGKHARSDSESSLRSMQ